MIGSILAFFEALFTEGSSTLGKQTLKEKGESPYSFLAITYIMGALVLFMVSLATKQEFIFSLQSIPFFTARLILDMILGYVGVKALMLFDRSFFSLVRVMTIPLLLLFDVLLGNTVSLLEMVAIGGMFFIFLLLCEYEHFTLSKMRIALPFALLPAFTLTLYKYDITHFNSVFAEQCISLFFLALFAFVMDLVIYKENPLRLFANPRIIAQATCAGIAEVAASFAYVFGTASVITGLRRAYSILFGLVSDVYIFKKKEDTLTLFSIAGIVCLVLLLTFY